MSCPSCQQETLPPWRHCARCGASLHGGASEREHFVTVVVNDLQGSTALAEKLDPESLRTVLDQYFEELGTVFESYGGRIEKRIGDAMVTVFGLASTDDDALRAVQAVAENQAILANLNARLEQGWGVRLTNRTGVASGTVVFVEAGAGHRVLAGRALDVAGSLEPVAPPLEALLAESTVALLRDRVVTDPISDVTLKNGKDTERAARLVSVEAATDLVERSAADSGAAQCLSCGTAIDLDAAPPWKWCPMCGSPVAVGGPKQISRRTLTIVFADLRVVAGSNDEADARRLATVRCFEELRAALVHHGATVEKFIGDAVMAVMGLEQRREDDALRAVRAALDMHAVVERLNPELDAELGVTLELRIGVNTGPVIAGDPRLGQRLVTGDAVNVAARLEQTAHPGDTVIGGLTRRLVGSAATVEELEPLTLKGKAEPVPAFRVDTASSGQINFARLELPLVGRDRELTQLVDAFTAAVHEQRIKWIKLVGDTGIGKSRLVYEMIDRLPRGARVLRGACLPYGEGITFWPIIELIQSAAGIGTGTDPEQTRDAVAALIPDPSVVERLWSLIGATDQQYPIAELFWATRVMLQQLAQERPLLVVIDGLHWAEPTLVELLDDVAQNLRNSPILLLTMARPPEVGADEEAAAPDPDVVHLSWLDEKSAEAVVVAALGHGALPGDLVERVTRAAAGNPLFIEQFLTMLIDDGILTADGDRWVVTADIEKVSVPPTIEAVLAARIDALADDERGTLEPASVVGREFPSQAIDSLLEHPVDTGLALAALLRRQLVVKARDPDLLVDHRFRTLLLRDVVYDGLLKRTRSLLHQRFAEWLESYSALAGRATELEEILAYHLEQAFLLRAGLGAVDDEVVSLGKRAAARLTSTGERAFVRGDMPAAANLLARASVTLPPDDAGRPRLLSRVGEARMETGNFRDAIAAYDQAEEAALAIDDPVAAGIAELGRVRLKYLTGDGVTEADARATVDRLIPVFDRAGDHRALAQCHRLLFNVSLTRVQWLAASAAADRMIEHARLAGDRLMEQRALPALAGSALYGPTPVPDAIARCQNVLERAGDDRMVRAITGRALAHLMAFDGRFDEARELCAQARSRLVELGWHFDSALVSINLGPIEMMAGDPDAAAAALRADYDTLRAMGEQNYISTTGALLAEARRLQGDLDEALALAAESAETSAEDDIFNQATWRSTRAKVLAARNEIAEARSLAAESVELALTTDDPSMQADMLVGEAEVLTAAGDVDGARASLEQAVERYRIKEHRVGERRVLAALETLTA